MMCSVFLLVLCLFAFGEASSPPLCASDASCNYNGLCIDGVCKCDPGWTQANCSALDLLPIPSVTSGVKAANASTWGGGTIVHNATDNTYHMWVAEFSDGCGLASWGANSFVRHVVSHTTPDGPYTPAEVAVDMWSHNPSVAVSPSDELIMWTLGNGTLNKQPYKCPPHNGTSPCSVDLRNRGCVPAPAPSATPTPVPCPAHTPAGYTCYPASCASDAASEGDATPQHCGADVMEPFLGDCQTWTNCTAVAAALCSKDPACVGFGLSPDWAHGTRTKLFGSGARAVPNPEWVYFEQTKPSSTLLAPLQPQTHPNANANAQTNLTAWVRVSNSTAGPWQPVPVIVSGASRTSNPAPFFFPNGTALVAFHDGPLTIVRADSWRGPYTLFVEDACAHGEDPFLYSDIRGRLHCLFHNPPYDTATIGHSYSEDDGRTWVRTPTPAAGPLLEYPDLDRPLVVAKRERPHLAFDKAGNPAYLITGVAVVPMCDVSTPNYDPAWNCSTAAQYPFVNVNNVSPGFWDRSFTLVQGIAPARTGTSDTPGL